jgi:Nucleotidyltransferase of unknown function (DUF6036)
MATDIAVSLPKPWPDFLKEVDAQLSQQVNLHCIGGFVITALYGMPRPFPTADVDYIKAVPREAGNEVEKIAGRESALCKKYRLFFQSVGIADFPEEYDSRLQELKLNLKKLKLWALDPYDLLLSKVPRNSPKDQEDAKYLIRIVKLDLRTFQDRWQKEMAPWIANRPRHDLTIELWKEYFQRE